MTASLYATSTYATSVAHDRSVDGGHLGHAVARPVVDGLDQSVCGLLVSASADVDWHAVPGDDRCEECTRITG